MKIDIDYDTGLFKIVELRQEQLSAILNCIMFAKGRGMKWPEDKKQYESNVLPRLSERPPQGDTERRE